MHFGSGKCHQGVVLGNIYVLQHQWKVNGL